MHASIPSHLSIYRSHDTNHFHISLAQEEPIWQPGYPTCQCKSPQNRLSLSSTTHPLTSARTVTTDNLATLFSPWGIVRNWQWNSVADDAQPRGGGWRRLLRGWDGGGCMVDICRWRQAPLAYRRCWLATRDAHEILTACSLQFGLTLMIGQLLIVDVYLSKSQVACRQ